MKSDPRHSALLVVDVQRDFCTGGALAAPNAERILGPVNRYLAEAHQSGMRVYASRDWHPAVTTHFKAYGGPWPPHCVEGTAGAEFHPDLRLPSDAIVVSKGDVPTRPGYSAFDGRTPEGRALLDDLRAHGIDALYVAGLTTEYCVKETALDAIRAGFRVAVLSDAVAGIDAHPGDADRAIQEMIDKGARVAPGLGVAAHQGGLP
jgi:nicotinamidase/pyrazinamidase